MACIYSAAILADDDIPITPEKINTLLKAAGIEVEAIWPTLYAKALQGVNIKDFITNIGSRTNATSTGPAAPVPAAEKPEAEKPEVKKEEPESDSDDDLGLNLFD